MSKWESRYATTKRFFKWKNAKNGPTKGDVFVTKWRLALAQHYPKI
jgi:hypothetical protein